MWPAATLAIVGLSGCWLQPGYGPERRNHNPFEQSLTEANAASLGEAWSTPSASGGQPLVAGATVYTGWSASSGALTVEATDRRTGTPRWQRQLTGSSPGAGAVVSVAGGEVLTARLPTLGPSRFEVLDTATGATTASQDVPEWLDVTALTVDEGDGVIAYRALELGGPGFELVVRDRDTFDRVFTAPGSSFGLGDGDPPLVAGGRVLVREEDQASGVPEIRVYDVAGCGAATCSPVATLPVPPPPASTGYVSYEARLLAVTDNGDLLLQRPWQDGRGLNVGIDLVAMASDGTLLWSQSIGETTGQFGRAGVATAGDNVFVTMVDDPPSAGSTSPMLARSGGTVWRSASPVARVAPVVAGGLVYVGGDVFDADGCGAPTCEPLVSLDVGTAGGIDGTSVTNGTLFVNEGGPDGRLLAFRPGQPPST